MFKFGSNRVKNVIMRRLLTHNQHRYKTILSGVDGTDYGYLALEESFTMSNAGDEVVGYHIPLDSYQFAYEHLVFQPGIPLSESQQKEYENQKQKFIADIEKKVDDIKTKSLKKDVKYF